MFGGICGVEPSESPGDVPATARFRRAVLAVWADEGAADPGVALGVALGVAGAFSLPSRDCWGVSPLASFSSFTLSSKYCATGGRGIQHGGRAEVQASDDARAVDIAWLTWFGC